MDRPGVPWRALLALSAAVLLAHLALLLGAAPALMKAVPTMAPTIAPSALFTRQIPPPTPAPATSRVMASPPVPRPVPPTVPVARAPDRRPPQAGAKATAAREAVDRPSGAFYEQNVANSPVKSEYFAPNKVAKNIDIDAPQGREAPLPSEEAAGTDVSTPVGAPDVPVQVPAPMRLQYDVTGSARGLRYSADAELLFRHDASQYEARLALRSVLGTRVQTSAGRIGPAGLAPTRFSSQWRGEQAAHFDPVQGRIRFSANTPDAPLLAGAQDRLSVVIQLGAQLAAAPARYPEGSPFEVQTAGPRDAEVWTFTLGATETLTLPAGPFETVKLSRAPRREYDQRVEAWLAPSLGHLPVRIRVTQSNGDFVDQQLRASVAP
ncbi:MAG: DUF3108 domain-containing protein [Burkholderiales bacterium]|nr:DUF3108 domain-containing protein [Burkholderiales bacterium]